MGSRRSDETARHSRRTQHGSALSSRKRQTKRQRQEYPNHSPRNALGRCKFAGRSPGWVQEDGSITVDSVPHRLPYRAHSGTLTAIVVRWPPATDPREALESVASGDQSGLCAAEAARLADPPQPPRGWHPLPATGREEIWAPGDDCVSLNCNDNVGIMCHPAAAPLTTTLRLRWSWRVDELPSQLPEDTKLTHDYVSIALAVRRRTRSDLVVELCPTPGLHLSLSARLLAQGGNPHRRSNRSRQTLAAGSTRNGACSPITRPQSGVLPQCEWSMLGSSGSASSKAAGPAPSSATSNS